MDNVNTLGLVARIEKLPVITLMDVQDHRIADMIEERSNDRERGHHLTSGFKELHYLREAQL